MKIDLKDELQKLRASFHLKLAKKRNINVDKEEINRVIYKMDDEETQNYIEKSQVKNFLRFITSSIFKQLLQ